MRLRLTRHTPARPSYASHFRDDVLTDVLSFVLTQTKNYVHLRQKIASELDLSGAFGGIRTPNLLIRRPLKPGIRCYPGGPLSDR